MIRRIALALFVLVTSACAASPQPPQLVMVTLNEFSIESSITSFVAGKPYRFLIKNAGALEHEFVVSPAEMAGHHDMQGEGMQMDETMLHVGSKDLPPGATVVLEVTFDRSGSIIFACYIPGHYEAGMFLPTNINS